MSLRILMAADFYPPFLGGLERQAQLLSTELVGRGHEVSVATVWHRGLPEREENGGVTIHRLKGLTTAVPWFSTVPGRRYHPPFPDPAITWRVRRLIAKFRPDVVHAHGWIAYSCAAALWGQTIPLLISAHDYGYSCAVRILLRRGQICDGPAPLKCAACAVRTQGPAKGLAAVLGVFSGRRLLRRKVVAAHSVSSFVHQFVQRHVLDGGSGVADGRAVMIPDIGSSALAEGGSTQPPALRGGAGLPDEPYILYVGGLTAAKGIGPLLAAYQGLANPPPLVLIGTVWPDTPKGFPAGVTVLQNLPNAKVMDAWAHSLFGVQPSLCAETFGLAVVEAMTQGKAVVASRVGGMVDLVIDDETGLLVPPGDTVALTQALQRLVEDSELRQRLGRAGQARAQLFTASAIVPRFEALYVQLAGAHAQPAMPLTVVRH